MSQNNPRPKKPLSDYLGISSATICLLHCLASPILMSMGVAVHNHTPGHDHHHGHGWEVLLSHSWDFLFLGIGLVAVWWSARHTTHRGRKLLMWVSFGFLAGAILLEQLGPLFQFLTYVASVMLISAHAANIRAIFQGKQSEVVCLDEACVAERA